MAERLLPEATLWTLLKSAEDRGRTDLAQLYMGELMFLMRQKMMQRGEMEQAQQQQAVPQRGFEPEVMPDAALGGPPPQPVPPNGMVAPGTPRPGAGNIGPMGPGGL